MTLAYDLSAALDPAVLFEHAFGLEPLGWQSAFLRATRPAVLLKGRQVGASMAAAALAIHATLYEAGINAVIVSPSLKQSTEITIKARAGLWALGARLIGDSTSTLRLANGSRILSLPGTARSVRGWTAKLLILDEAAYIADETITAARALVATGGRLVMQSTPADEQGAFYELVQSEDPDWAHFAVRADEVPTISPAFLDAERRSMSPAAFASEYECKFAPTGAALFSLASISSLFPEEDS